jgi:hypothetical protein
VAALALGALSSALGIPLAPEQISLLITAGSVVLYLVSQVRALWRPDKVTPAALVLVLALGLHAHGARAEIHTVTLIPPTQKEDNSSLDLTLLHSWRIQCGIGTSSSTTSSWSINDEVSFPNTTKDYDFASGAWICRAWVVATYSCASMQTPDGAWTFGSGGDQYGNDLLINGQDANGTAHRLVYTAGKTYAEAGDNPATWWSWGGPLMPWWSGPETAPTIAASDPHLAPSDPPLCQSANTPDLLFSIPMNSTQKTSNAKPKAASLSLSNVVTHP